MWTSQGLLGQILEEIRQELSGTDPVPLPALPNFKQREPACNVSNSVSSSVAVPMSTESTHSRDTSSDKIKSLDITDVLDTSSSSSVSEDESSIEG